MAAQKGSAMLLKIDISGTATTVAGLRSTSISMNDEAVDVTTKDSSGLRQLLAGGGVQSFSVSGSGVFTDDATEIALRAAFDTQRTAGTFTDFDIFIPNFGTFAGPMMIASIEYAGEYNGEVTYSVTLESAGTFAFTAL
jgi:TP901-1 family phage major tail protein